MNSITKPNSTDWFKPRGYLHFDPRLDERSKSFVLSVVTDPKAVSRHSFYPFIRYEVTKYKISANDLQVRRLNAGETRPISYAAHMDAQIFSYYSSILNSLYEQHLTKLELQRNVIAFRKLHDPELDQAMCNIHLARDAFRTIKNLGECKVFAYDIKSFFDRLEHVYLKKAWKKILGLDSLGADHFAVFKAITKYSYVSKEKLFEIFDIPDDPAAQNQQRVCSPSEFRDRVRHAGLVSPSAEKGIPQGSPISATLANIYMLQFDIELNQLMKEVGGTYYRYCDDILCIIPGRPELDLTPIVQDLLKKSGDLFLNPNKTETANFSTGLHGALMADKPIQYLGFTFDGRRIHIGPASIAQYQRKAKSAISLAKQTALKHNRMRLKQNIPLKKLFKKDLYNTYFRADRSTFLNYSVRAAKIMDSVEIKKQYKKLQRTLYDAISVASEQSIIILSKRHVDKRHKNTFGSHKKPL